MHKLRVRLAKVKLLLARKLRSSQYMKAYNEYLKAAGMDIDGKFKFIHPSVHLDTGYARHIHVGNDCVVSVNSIILAHDYSPECGMIAIGKGDPQNEKKVVRDVYIGHNVFIGAGCIVLPGTHIGSNCVIGAGTVCSGNIPENSIITGGKWEIIAKTDEWIKKKVSAVDSEMVC